MNTEHSFVAGSKQFKLSEVKGVRTHHVVTMNLNKASLDVVKSDSCPVPFSLHLLYDFKNANGKSRFLNNLSGLIAERLQINFAEEIVYDDNSKSLLRVYKDLWKSNSERNQIIEYDESLRKLVSKDDNGTTSGSTGKVADKLMFDKYVTKQRVRFDRIVEDHGFYAPHGVIATFRYIISLPKVTNVIKSQSVVESRVGVRDCRLSGDC